MATATFQVASQLTDWLTILPNCPTPQYLVYHSLGTWRKSVEYVEQYASWSTDTAGCSADPEAERDLDEQLPENGLDMEEDDLEEALEEAALDDDDEELP